MENRPVSTQTIRRLPVYLRYLKSHTAPNVSATAIADAFDLNEVQVRKDLAAISGGGRSGVGYQTEALITDIEHYLGYDHRIAAALVGAGNLGQALMGYAGFAQCGLDIRAAFDTAPERAGLCVGGVTVYPMDEMEAVCRKESVRIGIITVPVSAAQAVCDRLVQSGVRAVWNFAPVHLSVGQDVILQNENLAASLTVLSKRLADRLKQDQVEATDNRRKGG